MTPNVRQPAVAGSFYPGSPAKLAAMLGEMTSHARKIVEKLELPPRRPAAVILPHAGYVYSGVAAAAGMLAASAGFPDVKRAVLIAPSHRIGFNGVAVGTYTGFATPIGDLPADLERQDELRKACDGRLLHCSDRALAAEHALEVELPLILSVFGAIPVLAAVTGSMHPSEARKLAAHFSPFAGDGETLFVVSSDFTHYGADFGYVPFKTDIPDNLRRLDLTGAGHIAAGDLDGFGRFLSSTGATICGAAGIKLVMAALEAGGGCDGKVVCYTNSGILTGDFSHCVGYCSMLLYQKEM